jgi:flagellar basal body-associated protein FliL
MANDIVEEAAPSSEQPAANSGKRKNLMMGGVLLGIMLAEGGGVFMLAKHFAGPPAAAVAAPVGGLDAKAGAKASPETEVEVVRLRAQNEKSQQLRVYDITVAGVFEEKETKEAKGEAKGEEKEKEGEGAAGAKPTSKVAELLLKKKATLQDRFGRIVRSMDPQRFSEPDLTTLREQFKRELQQIVGEEAVVKEVLIPSITRSNED